jgi:hypothetical protein
MAYYRHVRTTNERRQWAVVEELHREYGSLLKFNRSRSFKLLPDVYDEPLREPYFWRSWKKYRKHQYRIRRERRPDRGRHPPSKC